MSFTYQSYSFILAMQKALYDRLKIEGCLSNKIRNVYYLTYSYSESLRLERFMYKDSEDIRLDRKFDSFAKYSKPIKISDYIQKGSIVYQKIKRCIQEYNPLLLAKWESRVNSCSFNSYKSLRGLKR